MKDDRGVVQIFLVSPNGGEVCQLTCNPWDIASTFTWSPDGNSIAHIMDNSVFVTSARTGESRRLTPRAEGADAPLPHACVISPDGLRIAYLRGTPDGSARIFVTDPIN